MRLKIENRVGPIAKKRLVYRSNEFSFDMMPVSDGFASVLLDDLNLEVDKLGRLISIWGMCPHTRWNKSDLEVPVCEWGTIFFIPHEPFLSGVSVALNEKKFLSTYIDVKSGWLMVKVSTPAEYAVKLSEQVIIEVCNGDKFCSLWLNLQQDVSEFL